MTEARYNYAGPYSSYEKAYDSLVESYADGDVSPSENPKIEKHSRKVASWDKTKPVWYITLPC